MKIIFKQYQNSKRIDILFAGKTFKGIIKSSLDAITKVGKDKVPSIIAAELTKDNIDVNN